MNTMMPAYPSKSTKKTEPAPQNAGASSSFPAPFGVLLVASALLALARRLVLFFFFFLLFALAIVCFFCYDIWMLRCPECGRSFSPSVPCRCRLPARCACCRRYDAVLVVRRVPVCFRCLPGFRAAAPSGPPPVRVVQGSLF